MKIKKIIMLLFLIFVASAFSFAEGHYILMKVSGIKSQLQFIKLEDGAFLDNFRNTNPKITNAGNGLIYCDMDDEDSRLLMGSAIAEVATSIGLGKLKLDGEPTNYSQINGTSSNGTVYVFSLKYDANGNCISQKQITNLTSFTILLTEFTDIK